MFRIDRRFVKLEGTRTTRTIPVQKIGAGAEGENPDDAAASAEIIASLLASTDVHAAAQAIAESVAGTDDGDDEIAGDEAGDEEPGYGDPSEVIEDFFENAEAAAEERANLYMAQAEKAIEEREQKIISEAREKAAKIIQDAEAEAIDIKKNAQEEGYAAGHAGGLEKGTEEGRHAFDEELERKLREDDEKLNGVLEKIARGREEEQAVREQETVALAVEIVRKVINPAEEELGTVFTSLLKNALRQIPPEDKFTIRVSPAEYDRFFPAGGSAVEMENGKVITITALRDTSLEEGDLIIDAGDETINAGITTQIGYAEAALTTALESSDETGEEEAVLNS